MPIPLGVLAVAGAGAAGGGGSFDLLETTLITTNTASVTFSSLGSYSAYKHLQLRIVARTSATGEGTNDSISIQLNNDTGTNYPKHELTGNGSSVISDAQTGRSDLIIGYTSSNDATADAFSAVVTDILDFSSSSKNTTLRSFSGRPQTSNRVSLLSGFWNNTAAVTEIDIFLSSNLNFKAGTRLSLYGIK